MKKKGKNMLEKFENTTMKSRNSVIKEYNTDFMLKSQVNIILKFKVLSKVF